MTVLFADLSGYTAVAERIASDYELFRLPVIALGCSHEHAGFAGTLRLLMAPIRVTPARRALRQRAVRPR